MQQKRSWEVELNGEVIEKVLHLKISNSKFGEVNYGLTPAGYDGWSFHEIGGGGVVTVPFSIIDGELYVGLVKQLRHNQGGEAWNVPRGFLSPDENHFKAAIREYEEEVRYLSPDKRVKPLEGESCNPNSAFFETAEKGEGVKYYSIEILPTQLELDPEQNAFRFRSGLLEPATKQAELILKCRFFGWRKAVQVADMFTVAAAGRLLAAQLVKF